MSLIVVSSAYRSKEADCLNAKGKLLVRIKNIRVESCGTSNVTFADSDK